VFTPGFVFLVGVYLTLPEDLCSLQVLFSLWGLSYPSRRPLFTPGFVYLVGSVFPFSRTCVHSRFCLLGGICLSLLEDLCSLRVCFLGGVCLTLPQDLFSLPVLFTWWDLSFRSRGPVFTPGFVFLVGFVLPFPSTCGHSRFCFLVTWSEHRSSGRVRQTPPRKQNLE
jgi:hypothetical protein